MTTGSTASELAKSKRTLTGENVGVTLGNALRSSPAFLMGLVKPRTSAALREKIMLGVTSVTDCRLCQWGHSHWANAHGVPLEEINEILGQQGDSLRARSPDEAAAILFAQHYAETDGRFDPDALEDLREYYDDGQIAEILGSIRAIMFGSLTGNTIDAFIDRFRKPSRKD